MEIAHSVRERIRQEEFSGGHFLGYVYFMADCSAFVEREPLRIQVHFTDQSAKVPYWNFYSFRFKPDHDVSSRNVHSVDFVPLRLVFNSQLELILSVIKKVHVIIIDSKVFKEHLVFHV